LHFFVKASMPVRKRQAGSVGKKGDYKKKRNDTAQEKHEATDMDNFFMEEEEGAPPPGEDEPEEVAETAEQKRLRLGAPRFGNLSRLLHDRSFYSKPDTHLVAGGKLRTPQNHKNLD